MYFLFVSYIFLPFYNVIVVGLQRNNNNGGGAGARRGNPKARGAAGRR
jgi:hypothetical protein